MTALVLVSLLAAPARAGAAAESVPVLLYHQIAAAGEDPRGT